jgi:hypothetical protein
MPPQYGLYSLANTPEELLNRGYGYSTDIPYNQLSDAEENLMYTKYDPAFGNLNTDFGYFSAPYTGAQPFQNASFLRAKKNSNLGFNIPSFGGSGNPRFNQFEPTGILSQVNQKGSLYNTLPIDTSYGVANEPDELDEEETEKYEVDEFGYRKEPSGIAQLVDYLPFGEKSLGGALLRNLLPQESPEIKNIKNFYRQNYGLDSIGRIDSGIMKGYNPVSGSDLLNKITFGIFPAQQFGLADAARKRINKIANRKIAQTAASLAKIKELQKFARADTISRARQAAPDVYASADKQGFTGPGGGFKSAGTNENFSNKTGRGRTGY